MPFGSSNPLLLHALSARGYDEPTAVQSAVLQDDAAGPDLLVSAQTGSGKTVAFGLAIAPEVLGGSGRVTGRPGAPAALVIAPTRELALQVRDELAWLYAETGARVIACVGGTDARREARLLSEGAHIVVGTPGRLVDHLTRRNLDLSAIRAAVLDEADEMLDLGFREELEALLDATPAERRTLLFSATIPGDIVSLARRYQRNALRITAAGEGRAHADISYRAMLIQPRETEAAVVNVLRWFAAPVALVFCNTREAVGRLQERLAERGFVTVALSGELTQTERNRALQALRDRRAQVCVATDVAARGIDLPDLGLVVHADLPRERSTLLHRSGRTGRAGRAGVSVLLVPASRRRAAEHLLSNAQVEASWSPPPNAAEIRQRDGEHLTGRAITAAAEAGEDDRALGGRLLAAYGADTVATALASMLRATLPVPEELTLDAPPRPARAARPDGNGVWFRISVGRRDNADPRWLLPLLCRRGDLTRHEIGRIQILDRETRVEIAAEAAPRMAAALANDESDPRITPETNVRPRLRRVALSQAGAQGRGLVPQAARLKPAVGQPSYRT